ncbi:uncharacterized protein LOC128895139 [Hylaeus anthracinus]|uniref:uncharacterized protein LOC128895139 n=1 Tax=Hylaeus anthracinus TaxID=313031 RepID=UPI0023BA36E6|nr:uncharacterized protein LOC128895139 [Hylaeus anthracinus]
MDSDIEQIHNIVLDARLPSSTNHLKNPTEQFVVNLITTFLRRFHIDVGAIDKPTIEQYDIMSYSEDTEIIGIINLQVAMIQLCERIYIKELCITDIISPGSKRVRKQAKFLANFILYATTKESDIKDKISKIKNKVKTLQDIIDRKNEAIEMINNKALHTAKQLSLKNQYIADIQKLQARLENNNKIHAEVLAKMSLEEERKQPLIELNGSYKVEVLKLSKIVVELQSEIVKSPEKYKMRLKELEKQQTSQNKQRELMQQTCQDKKHLIEQQNVFLTFIQKQQKKFSEVPDTIEQLKNITAAGDSSKKQIEMLRADIKECEKRLERQKDERKENEIDGLCAQYDERLSSLRNLNIQLSSKKKLCQEELKEVLVKYNEDCLKLKKMQSTIKKLEDETVGRLKSYQDNWNNEVLTEKALWETWMNR